MNQQRLARVLRNMERDGLEQIVVTSTASVYYLTGYWVEPMARMLALHLRAGAHHLLDHRGAGLAGLLPGGLGGGLGGGLRRRGRGSLLGLRPCLRLGQRLGFRLRGRL